MRLRIVERTAASQHRRRRRRCLRVSAPDIRSALLLAAAAVSASSIYRDETRRSVAVVQAWFALPTTIRRRPRGLLAGRSASSANSNGRNDGFVHVRYSTPFEAGFYDDDDGDNEGNPYDVGDIETGTARSAAGASLPPDTLLVLGLNKYSHDTTLCAADAKSGQVLFALSKERLTRRKHDSGNAAGLVECCLDVLGLPLGSIEKVVMNNHHHRILPFIERSPDQMEWEAGLRINGGMEDGYDDPENLLMAETEDGSSIRRLELSHHLAHAYGTAAQAPFDRGLCFVADGMGETFRTMQRAVDENDPSYVSDFSLASNGSGGGGEKEGVPFQCVPHNLKERAATSYFDWREAESVYAFAKNKETNSIEIKPLFKRFTEENTPPTLYNHGFENMDSVGALYSRASSHIFGDWNACGKVMVRFLFSLSFFCTHLCCGRFGSCVSGNFSNTNLLATHL